MSTSSSVRHIRHAQKESLFFKEITHLLRELSLDDPRVRDMFVNRVSLSPDCGICTAYLFTPQGKEYFESRHSVLKSYAPGMRKVLSQKLKVRHTPEIFFRFDEQFEKQERVEKLFEEIKTETEPS